ncbi:MAG: N-acetyltransferase [Bacteroidales bacterium]|nr:N-acetyltransferase [Bacteroidales bacterium]
MIRLANSKDYKSIHEIYKPFVESTAISFEFSMPSLSEYSKRIDEIQVDYPWLVLDINGQVAGYAYASKHRKRAAYQWAAEVSVYVDKTYYRKHAATALYHALSSILEMMGVRMLLAGITLPNEASVRFHESMGFEPIGIYKNIGFKFGKWHSVGWWQKEIGNINEVPQTIAMFSQIQSSPEVLSALESGFKIFNK